MSMLTRGMTLIAVGIASSAATAGSLPPPGVEYYKNWPAFNDIYRRYFTLHFPARMAFATAGLALGARVEVQCNATLGAN